MPGLRNRSSNCGIGFLEILMPFNGQWMHYFSGTLIFSLYCRYRLIFYLFVLSLIFQLIYKQTLYVFFKCVRINVLRVDLFCIGHLKERFLQILGFNQLIDTLKDFACHFSFFIKFRQLMLRLCRCFIIGICCHDDVPVYIYIDYIFFIVPGPLL